MSVSLFYVHRLIHPALEMKTVTQKIWADQLVKFFSLAEPHMLLVSWKIESLPLFRQRRWF